MGDLAGRHNVSMGIFQDPVVALRCGDSSHVLYQALTSDLDHRQLALHGDLREFDNTSLMRCMVGRGMDQPAVDDRTDDIKGGSATDGHETIRRLTSNTTCEDSNPDGDRRATASDFQLGMIVGPRQKDSTDCCNDLAHKADDDGANYSCRQWHRRRRHIVAVGAWTYELRQRRPPQRGHTPSLRLKFDMRGRRTIMGTGIDATVERPPGAPDDTLGTATTPRDDERRPKGGGLC